VEDTLHQRRETALSERRVLKEQHDVLRAHKLEEQLRDSITELRDALTDAKSIIAEGQQALERETAAVQLVGGVWQGTFGVSRYVYREGRTFLREDDKWLARQWASSIKGEKYAISAMDSARCAELVALDIYRELYGQVEDLSILQKRAPADIRWKTADIDAAGRLVDIKNARRSFSSPNSYSEHCVKQFKQGSRNSQVIVSGFLSPHRRETRLGRFEAIVWLGETSLGTIESLRLQFETDYLELDLSGKGANRIPPWLFDYPEKCYAERDRALAQGRAPSFVLPRTDCPLGFLVLADRVEQSSSGDTLLEEALALARRIRANGTATRPVLFLHVLDRFCCTAREGVSFPSSALRQILFSAKAPVPPNCSLAAAPLAVFDPLETVRELLEVLERVADRCAKRAIAYTSFKLVGTGILRGRRKGGKWQTIFGYCGGSRRLQNGQIVKCGQCPLYLGQNEPCETCGNLVCHAKGCGYCSKKCGAPLR
jgi:hypothetical protein